MTNYLAIVYNLIGCFIEKQLQPKEYASIYQMNYVYTKTCEDLEFVLPCYKNMKCFVYACINIIVL